MNCPKCQRKMAEGSIVCPYCLERLDKKHRSKARTGWLIFGMIVIAAAAAAIFFFLTGCSDAAILSDSDHDGQMQASDEMDSVPAPDALVSASDEIIIFDSGELIYAGSPVVGTWVMYEDYEDGYDDWDYISEFTADGLVYEWYGDGLGYYLPLCAYEYTGDSIIYHYLTEYGASRDHDVRYSCAIDGSRMVTTDAFGVSCEFIRISENINLSVAEVRELYAG